MNKIQINKFERIIETDNYLIVDETYGIGGGDGISIGKKPIRSFQDWSDFIHFNSLSSFFKDQIKSDNPDFEYLDKFCAKFSTLKIFL